MKAVFLSVLMVCALAEAGIYYLADEVGNVTRHEGDTPYPPGAVWKTKCPRTADEKTLSIVEGFVVVDPVKANAAQAAAEAAATLPAQFPTGIATTNAAGHWVEFVPDGTNVVAQTLAIQVSQSPLTQEQREAMKAAALADRAAKRAKAKAAKAKGGGVPALAERIAALEALAGIE